MKIKMKYDTAEVEMDVDVNELTGWLSIEIMEEESEDELQKRIQEEIDKQYNRPDYNNWHTHNRHIGYSKSVFEDVKDSKDSVDHFKEPLIDEVRDSRIFYKSQMEHEEHQEYTECCALLAKHIQKPELLDLFIKVALEDYTLREMAMLQHPKEKWMSDNDYKKLIAKEENNLSHKWRRLRKKLEKTSDFSFLRGYLVEDTSSRKR
ncbi:hypothetical protein KG089_00380 [Carnobacteriaceae bacterium zg-ZUI252]|nr:hypothetical protein [Carnobacteriaceae bacterium zg-ZUI252]